MPANTLTFKRLFLLVDVIVLIVSFFIGVILSRKNPALEIHLHEIVILGWLLVIWILLSVYSNPYNETRNRGMLSEVISTSVPVFFLLTFTIFLLFFIFKDHHLSRRFAIVFFMSFYLFMIIKNFTVQRYLESKKERKIIILGNNKNGMNFYREMVLNSGFGFRLVGFITENPGDNHVPNNLGSMNDFDKIFEKTEVNDVVVALSSGCTYSPKKIIEKCENYSVRVHIIPDFSYINQPYNITSIRSFPIISLRPSSLYLLQYRLIKRMMDIGITSLLFLTVFWWLWPLLAMVIRIDSKGPVFYRQERWGLFNKPIRCFKFRSMYVNSPQLSADGKFMQATKSDPRITRIGRFLRKTNLDELPQFLNVLLGDMSIVGPRPHAIAHNLQLRTQVQCYMQRHKAKPGITGWAQVNGYRGETKDIELMKRRVECDMWYIESWTPLLDLRIFLKTIWLLFRGDKNAY